MASTNSRGNYYKRKSKEYYKTESGRIAVKNANKRMYEKSPEKRKARAQVRYHLDKGNIKRGKCIFCNKNKTQAHHEDYSKPLEIIWVCTTCHADIHRGILTVK